MRKSLIITAALMLSSLVAGSAMADESSRGAERPTLRADRSDGAKAYSEKLRERTERQGRAVTTRGASAARKLDSHRQKGDMVDESKSNSRKSNSRTNREIQARLVKTVSEKRADLSDNAKKNQAQNNSGKRAFTIANDRRGHAAHDGPKSVVDVMARRELMKFLGATGVKINCGQTGTCTEDPI